MTTLEFFVEMGWKSALIAAAALGFAAILRSRAASDRALVLRFGVAMLLLLPLIALGLPALEIVAFAAPEAPPALDALPPEVIAELLRNAPTAAPAAERTIWDDPTPLVLIAYLAGLLMIGARLFGGLFLLNRWTRNAQPVTCPEWLAAFEDSRWAASNAEDVRLLVSDRIGSPLSWGWRHPTILIDPDTLAQPEDASGILAHEMAHIARRDWPVLIAARLVATLFWFNPLVWLLEREVVQQAEEAADLAAASRIEPSRYAETLLSWAQANGALPANSIATQGSALGRRVRAILDRRSRERPAGSAWTAFAILACLMVAAPVAAAKLVAAVRAPEAPPVPSALAAAQAPRAPGAPAAPGAPEAPEAPLAPDAADAPDAPDAPDVPDVYVNVGPEVAAAVRDATAAVRAQIPQIVASARAAANRREVQQALREAEQEMREAGRLSHVEIAAAMRGARIAIANANVQVRAIPHAQINAAMERAREAQREAWRAQIEAQRHVRYSMRAGADGMERGADGMERGADRMEATAERLAHDRDYREREIARARARGEAVTHEQLIEAAEDMREGAQGMREGAREMRDGARRMREGRD